MFTVTTSPVSRGHVAVVRDAHGRTLHRTKVYRSVIEARVAAERWAQAWRGLWASAQPSEYAGPM